tara:strand:- start:1299 stop:2129 length:831 start_codon:yes stop_codon:yes gene_type:complete
MPSHALNDTDKASQTIFIHSTDAVVSISDGEKIFYLDEAITAPSGYRLIIGLTNMTMPNSIFNVTSLNNKIVLNDVDYEIDVGNYSATDLAAAVTAKIEDDPLVVGSCSFSDTDNKFSFTFGIAQVINEETTLSRQLGLSGQLPTSSVSSYDAQNICDLGGATNIYIRIRNLTMNNLDSRGRRSNIIASIVNNANYGGYIFFVPPETLYYQITEQNISHLDIELTDQDGNILELNGAQFNLTLTVHFVKQREGIFRNSLLREIRQNYENREEKNKK